MQNDCTEGRPGIAILLKGKESNRDGIGARIEVNGAVQFLSAGSGFLSQHSKKLHFGLAGRERAGVAITWPSGKKQLIAGLEPGSTYTIVEGDDKVTSQPFRQRRLFPSSDLQPVNAPQASRDVALRARAAAGKTSGSRFHSSVGRKRAEAECSSASQNNRPPPRKGRSCCFFRTLSSLPV